MKEIVDKIEYWDQQLFLFLNGLHVSFLDQAMYWISEKYTWIPFYALILVFLFWHFKYRAFYLLLGIGLVILFADQLTSGFMKPFFERPRPCHEPDLAGLVFQVAGCGGKFGFASSHAANTFGLAMFLWLTFKKNYVWVSLIFLWATVVSFSRIYLGVHYPLDIVVGGLLGVLIAWLVFLLIRKWAFNKRSATIS